MTSDPEVPLIHDHSHLNALLNDLDRALQAWSGDLEDYEPEALTPLDEAKEIMHLLKEDTFEHFEREEHGLFPHLRTEFPDLRETLDGLMLAHDNICEELESLERLLIEADDSKPEFRARVTASGKHLGVLYWQHTAVEWGMIRVLLERLDDERRATILEQLREI